jgi:hypothetical protein
MATYKILQDIEAEDKLVGPLSLRQFLYAAIVAVLGFLVWKLLSIGAAFMAIPLLPPMLLFAVLAAPFGHDQSSEIWLLAKIRFILKPRVRIWDQTGMLELVTVTAPKKIERQLTNGLNETQVQSRLQALAQTIDTRGWVVKGMDVNLYTNPAYAAGPTQVVSDRLVDPTSMAPQQVSDINITPMDDMLDTVNNPVAQQIDQLTQASDSAHRQQVLDQLEQVRNGKAANAGYVSQPFPQRAQSYATFTPQTVQPGMPMPSAGTGPPSLDDQLLTAQFARNNRQQSAYGNTRVIQPASQQQPQATYSYPPMPQLPQPAAPAPTPQYSAPPMKDPTNPGILELANNDDLSVATIARQANKQQPPADDEVVVSLH